VAVPTEPIDLTPDDKQLNCSSRQELSIGRLKIPKIKCLIFYTWVLLVRHTGLTDRDGA
jgi:hypothetical protein